MKERIGILGGSFNPVHLGHLLMAHAAAEAFKLDGVILLPCCVSPFKVGVPNQASSAQRLEMLRLSIAGDSLLRLCQLDIERGGISYAIDSVRALQLRLPAAELHFIIGSDSLQELHKWHRIHEMLELCAIITMLRPGIPALKPEDLGFTPRINARLLQNCAEGRLCDISATEIRERIAAHRSIKDMVHPDVEAYIHRQRLYQSA
jgi:nicotinate-nucleotide adenylyltransferase